MPPTPKTRPDLSSSDQQWGVARRVTTGRRSFAHVLVPQQNEWVLRCTGGKADLRDTTGMRLCKLCKAQLYRDHETGIDERPGE